MDTIILLVLLFAFLGALANAILAWLGQKPVPPFDVKSFMVAVIASIVTAVGIAEVFNYSGVTNTLMAIFGAFLSGMGTNSAVSDISNLLTRKTLTECKLKAIACRRLIVGSLYRW